MNLSSEDLIEHDKELGRRIIENLEWSKVLSNFNGTYADGIDFAEQFVRKECGLNGIYEE